MENKPIDPHSTRNPHSPAAIVFPVPENEMECRERIDTIKADIDKIQVDLSISRSDLNKDEEHEWRKRAQRARMYKSAELRQLRTWLTNNVNTSYGSFRDEMTQKLAEITTSLDEILELLGNKSNG